jgi:hypothetical protein
MEIGKELGDAEAKEAVYKEMEGMIGMENAKMWLTEVRRQIDFANLTGAKAGLKRCYNLVLTGKVRRRDEQRGSQTVDFYHYH